MTLFNSLQSWWRGSATVESLHQCSDGELLEKFQAEPSSLIFDVLIARHGDALFHFLITLSDAQLAEDISQQVWLKLIEKPARYQAQSANFRTWLFTVGRHAVIDELRRLNRWVWQSIEETHETMELDWQEDIAFAQSEEIQHQFNDAIELLPFAQREALVLQLEGFSLEDIANITYEKPETIKSRLRFARKQLKQTLEVNND